MGYRGGTQGSGPSGPSPIWCKNFDYRSTLASWADYTFFDHDLLFPFALDRNDLIVIDMVVNGSSYDAVDFYVQDVNGFDLGWPYCGNYDDPMFNRVTLLRSPAADPSADEIAWMVEGADLNNSDSNQTPWRNWGHSSSRSFAGLDRIRFRIGMDAWGMNSWGCMRGTLRIYRGNL